ncbi:MAG: hypothetical protein V4591_06400 [Bdellovibrionota bacterium]
MSITSVQRQSKIDIKKYKDIDEHLKKKIANHDWMSTCLEGNSSSFPYRLSENGKADIAQNSFFPTTPHAKMPSEEKDQKNPSYLVNIPMAYSSLKKNPALLTYLLNLFQKESFGGTDRESDDFSRYRLAVVIGINKHKSLDNASNNDFSDNISSLVPIQGISYRVLGFFWDPVWKKHTPDLFLYDARKGYKILKALSLKSAEKVLDFLEGSSSYLQTQVPFQKIRERIKNSDASRTFAEHFTAHAREAPTYFGVMDADCQSLRTNHVGLFSSIDQVALQHNNPSAISCGYSVPSNEWPLILLGVKLDMYVRAAMTSIIPYSAYLPEPGSFFCIRRVSGDHFLARTSFLSTGTALENRRFVQNGRLHKIFDDRVVFLKHGGVVTSTPARMRTQKNENIQFLTKKILKQKASLKALRDIAQSHATPKQWADNVYVALDFSCSQVTDVTTPMMDIFKIYDPISRMYALYDRFTCKSFDDIMKTYFDPLTDLQKKILQEEKNKLFALKMPEDMVKLIIEAAKVSGKAIYQALSEELTVLRDK